jgi:hypothetical protein
MPPTRNSRTRTEIAEANKALIARRRQQLQEVQNPTQDPEPSYPIPHQSKPLPGSFFFL